MVITNRNRHNLNQKKYLTLLEVLRLMLFLLEFPKLKSKFGELVVLVEPVLMTTILVDQVVSLPQTYK